jgi:hypothetical protein
MRHLTPSHAALVAHNRRVYNAVHEAGHAVVATLTGWPVRYLTLAPRHKMADGRRAGASVSMEQTKATRASARTPLWEADMMITVGGMAATAARNVLRYGRFDAILHQPRVTEDGGRGTSPDGGDLPYLRWIARRVWHNATDPAGPDAPPVDLGPAFNTSWAGDPVGVEAIAVHAWRRAVDLVCAHWGAVDAVVRAAVESPRAITGTQIAEIVKAAPAAQVDPADVLLDDGGLAWWPGTYSRLKFRPAPARLSRRRPRRRAATPDRPLN